MSLQSIGAFIGTIGSTVQQVYTTVNPTVQTPAGTIVRTNPVTGGPVVQTAPPYGIGGTQSSTISIALLVILGIVALLGFRALSSKKA